LNRYCGHLLREAGETVVPLRGDQLGAMLVSVEEVYVPRRVVLGGEPAMTWTPVVDDVDDVDTGEAVQPGTSCEIALTTALDRYRRLLVVGEPGSGKSTLLQYLAAIYAKGLVSCADQPLRHAGLPEERLLPIYVRLAEFAAFLGEAKRGWVSRALFGFLTSSPPATATADTCFLMRCLESGEVLLLLDGLDDIRDRLRRQRVLRLISEFVHGYPTCRIVVTSTALGYSEVGGLGGDFQRATLSALRRDDAMEDLLARWEALSGRSHAEQRDRSSTRRDQVSSTSPMLPSSMAPPTLAYTAAELAWLPLEVSVDALNTNGISAKRALCEAWVCACRRQGGGGSEPSELDHLAGVEGLLQALALTLHEHPETRVDPEYLLSFARDFLAAQSGTAAGAHVTLDSLLYAVQHKSRILVRRANGCYVFAFGPIARYLAARAVAVRPDYIAYTLARVGYPEWSEVIAFELDYLKAHHPERFEALASAFVEMMHESDDRCVAGIAAIVAHDASIFQGAIREAVKARLADALTRSERAGKWSSAIAFIRDDLKGTHTTDHRVRLQSALGSLGWRRFHSAVHGEPEWTLVPEGRYWTSLPHYDDLVDDVSAVVGDFAVESCEPSELFEGREVRVHVGAFAISRAPITNAQYRLYIEATGAAPPQGWVQSEPRPGSELHPVTRVTWHDAQAYCRWLGARIGSRVALPSEEQWEKAARGRVDKRAYPWGRRFSAYRCNAAAAGIGTTTPVGAFPEGNSPYGCVDMVGNVWEWTATSLAAREADDLFPFYFSDFPGAETTEPAKVHADFFRVIKGGGYAASSAMTSCASRHWGLPDQGYADVGFRVVVLRGDPE
jgi:formylglycine-generating enzyme required for sulfatase activity/energy-coupling factor transporter ATP-binding protein EcfA2